MIGMSVFTDISFSTCLRFHFFLSCLLDSLQDSLPKENLEKVMGLDRFWKTQSGLNLLSLITNDILLDVFKSFSKVRLEFHVVCEVERAIQLISFE